MCTMQENISLFMHIVKRHIFHEKRTTLIMKEKQKTNLNTYVECHISSKEPCFLKIPYTNGALDMRGMNFYAYLNFFKNIDISHI